MIEKMQSINQIMVDENNNVHIRRAIKIVEDGKVLSQIFDRTVLAPGSDITREEKKVQDICRAVWL